ncbi:hypothetical protein A2291_02820 [candidate division WOR-1 bacterium RIFOXYB2_FULL_42_35]|uniref:FAD dependent oxidoreductase domain-containing protein n=1 Tax=candidate division WOR-1 bacterium RIFOXYC2_FULL_41_25 TaxID=1802586 RepID=A0A1F4TR22_UNCSA|nr:MAG: hypothetical protein A2247_01130 [candidate division WOR-1 bacterium RIFOXYA2_FULL_41_14]OGC25685.1 MAG: hypothetical protein A2291_02820 [candidate division WOR-1 bacterium RIFOXYB2_FULL_42_35]OGC35087.1 MAG: hypothetical protein A2462_05965 [candidate division WOR-1 bacterium RIFOXYC2_FULL_41_25]OGC42410.1 MAG: hypothetical protein A2548_07530 [candidate division WOR-1 bacterium RIFOXYD2_FULL_41_8]
MDKVDITIIGAGVVGLSLAATLSDDRKSVFVLEKHSAFGQETSSRNSEVIHAGIYYPPGSLKAKLCVEGNQLLYDLCQQYNIPCQKLGKLIVATNQTEVICLEAILAKAKKNGVRDLKIISAAEVKKLEPNVAGLAAIYSTSTGIIDSHALMKHFEIEAKAKGAEISYSCEVVGVQKIAFGYEVMVGNNGDEFSFFSEVVINSAGLESDTLASYVGLEVEKLGYDLKYCKGDYFSVGHGKSKSIKHLVYPVPEVKGAGLGVHATLNLQGELRLGPDATYINSRDLNYDVDPNKATAFYESAKKILPFVELEDLRVDTSGIRPKLQGQGEGVRDFVIQDEKEQGLPGFINLIGIESPGLTASPAIAEYVRNLLL